MKLFLVVFLIGVISSCSKLGDSSGSSATTEFIKDFREDLVEAGTFASQSKLIQKFEGTNETQWTDTSLNFEFGGDTGLSPSGFFSREFDAERENTGSGNNFYHRLDSGLLVLCALMIDLGEDLEVGTKTLTVLASDINRVCETNLPDNAISLTNQEAVVTEITDSGSFYNRKVEVDGMTIYVNNSGSLLRVAYGINEGSEADRVVLELNKSNGNFEFELMQYDGGYQTIYRALKSAGSISIFGKTPEGSGAEYFALFQRGNMKMALDYKLDERDRSVCIAQNGSTTSDYSNCHSLETSLFDLEDFLNIRSYNLFSNIDDWTSVDETTSLSFTLASDMDTVSF